MTSFGLGIWVYQETGSVTQYTWTLLFTLIPLSLGAPVAGALVDRWDRRKVILYGDLIAGCNTLVVAALLATHNLDVWHIYAAAAVNALTKSFQMPAYHATITLLVPKHYYGKASGMVQLSDALGLLIAPPLAGLLLFAIQIEGIILLDFATFLFAFTTLLAVKLPRPPVNANSRQSLAGLTSDIVLALRFIGRWPGFIALAVYVVFFLQFLFGIAQTLITPLVLSFAEPGVFGLVIGAIGIGAVAGAGLLAVWGGPQRRANGIFIFAVPYGIGMIVGGMQANAWMIAAGGFGLALAHAMIIGCNRAIWQAKIPANMQGRVFALRLLVGIGAQALGTLLAGPLADNIFEPLLADGGLLAGSTGQIIGIGPGRGIGLIFIMLGSLVLLGTIIAFTRKSIRFVEDDMPEAALTSAEM